MTINGEKGEQRKKLLNMRETEPLSMTRADEEHFTVTTKINVSLSFFAWLCTFGKRVRIVSHAPVVNDFKKYLDNIRSAYE